MNPTQQKYLKTIKFAGTDIDADIDFTQSFSKPRVTKLDPLYVDIICKGVSVPGKLEYIQLSNKEVGLVSVNSECPLFEYKWFKSPFVVGPEIVTFAKSVIKKQILEAIEQTSNIPISEIRLFIHVKARIAAIGNYPDYPFPFDPALYHYKVTSLMQLLDVAMQYDFPLYNYGKIDNEKVGKDMPYYISFDRYQIEVLFNRLYRFLANHMPVASALISLNIMDSSKVYKVTLSQHPLLPSIQQPYRAIYHVSIYDVSSEIYVYERTLSLPTSEKDDHYKILLFALQERADFMNELMTSDAKDALASNGVVDELALIHRIINQIIPNDESHD